MKNKNLKAFQIIAWSLGVIALGLLIFGIVRVLI